MKPSTRNSTTQTAPVLTRKGTRADACWTRSQASLIGGSFLAGSFLRGGVQAVPLLRQRAQRAVLVEVPHDRVHRLVQRLRRRVRALVEADRERLVEDRVTHDLHRVAGVD